MKKALSVIFAAFLVLCCMIPAFAADPSVGAPALCIGKNSSSFGAYKHVFIIGIDGAGQFFERADTPNFDRIFANGAVKYNVRTEVPTDSGPNWASMLTGVSYYRHWIHNGNSGEVRRDSSTKTPTIFCVARNAMPNAELASFVNWNNINYGMIETDIGVTEHQNSSDDALTDDICAYFDAGNQPALFFVQIDCVDAAGHGYGSESTQYYDAIHEADGYMGRIYDAAVRNGLMEDGLFIVTADHGHTIAGGHGRFSKRESLTTIAVTGKTVVNGGKMDLSTRDRDIASIALFALGIDKPLHMSSRLPANLFENTAGEPRQMILEPLDAIISPFMWIVTLFTPDR